MVILLISASQVARITGVSLPVPGSKVKFISKLTLKKPLCRPFGFTTALLEKCTFGQAPSEQTFKGISA
jgi:hypothetical protein